MHRPRPVVVVIDVTYFGSWGVLVVIDPNARPSRGDNLVLYHAFLSGSEKTVHYEVALDTLEELGYQIAGATIDGRRGVRELHRRGALEADQPVSQCSTASSTSYRPLLVT